MSKENMNEDKVATVKLTDVDTGEVYVLDFSRESVKFAEARGFKVNEISDFPATRIPEFFFYAFRKNHKRVARSQTDDLLEKMGGVSTQLLERLIQLYNQAALTHLIVLDEDDEKNVTVTVEL
jgi:hypothetical protein|nr:MAG TPA: protein of unknown function (DUF5055) [Caudoviricetes sp.]